MNIEMAVFDKAFKRARATVIIYEEAISPFFCTVLVGGYTANAIDTKGRKKRALQSLFS